MNNVTARSLNDWLINDETSIARLVATNGKQDFTLTTMRHQVMSLCQQLMSCGESRWALCFDDSYLFTVALLAALHAGKTPVIYGHCRESVLREQDDEFDGLLTDNRMTLACRCLYLSAETSPRDSHHIEDVVLPPVPDDACLILFTSGSTGKPRQIHKPIRCMDEEARWLARLWGERLCGCHVMASVTHQHMYGLTFRIWLPMSLGLSFDSRQVLYSEQLAAHSSDRRYAFISSPAFLRRIDHSLQAPFCELIVSAGGVLPWPCAQSAQQWLGSAVDEIYGSTETGVMGWRSRQDEQTVWQPFPGVSFQGDDDGSWRARSALISPPEGMKLDDKLAFDERGCFQLCGRHDRIVKIEDKRISLSEIERRLLSLPEIDDAVALQVTRQDRSGIGVVLVLKSPMAPAGLPALKRQWRHELHKWLEPVAMPRFWRIVDAIPLNSQSKRAWPQIQELFHAAG
ncbi:AMP-binding protein [Dickeya fangzhongdai]|uniref:AMP-binding protein n=1 Tax=Dickeya fangzhongdai TaxID=1778540 RepID=UPI0026E0E2E0|nr:AMP-binding protein [Dickeya fangzhongdai]WKV49063.1 AMP-binding protein [Dickeya fangzhongdai]